MNSLTLALLSLILGLTQAIQPESVRQSGLKNQSVPIATKLVYEFDDHVYSFYIQPLNWDEASDSCERDGGYLAVLEDLREVNLISSAMDQDLCSFSAFQNLWIGGRFNLKSERWYWEPTGYEISGKIGDEVGYPPWHINLRPDYDCLLLEQDLMKQPQFADLECFRERRYLCEQGCARLYDTDEEKWEPKECTSNPNKVNDHCTLVCNPGYVLDDVSEVECTKNGWESPLGLNKLPRCRNGNDIGDDLIEDIGNLIDGKDVEFLFVIHESSTISDEEFSSQINISKAIIKAFPLSVNRSAGLITFSDEARVHIPVNTDSSCRFLGKADKILRTDNNGTEIISGLEGAEQEIESNRAHNTTIVFLFAGETSFNGAEIAAANEIKSEGSIIAISLSKTNAVNLRPISSKSKHGDIFYGIDDESILQVIPEAIERKYGNNFKENCTGVDECNGLSNTDRGHWSPPTCNTGTIINGTCNLICNENYTVHGPRTITCQEDGWAGPVGILSTLPSCYTLDETGGDFGDEINRTLSQYVDASFLFIVDESGSVSENSFRTYEIPFVGAIVNAFPLSKQRRAGFIGFDSSAIVEIPLTADDTCTFLKQIDKVKYYGGGTDNKKALETANIEMLRNNPSNKTLIILITDGQSSTDPVQAAEIIKSQGNLLFTVGVDAYDENQLIRIASVSDEGVPHFFGIKNFDMFEVISEYLNSTYNLDNREDCSIACKALPETDRGTWQPTECSVTSSNPGAQCTLSCNAGYELRGSNPLVCGEDGWTGTAGDFKIPKCETPEELGGDFVDKINSTLAGGVKSNLLFVLDESGSVDAPNFQMEIDFVKAVVTAFPLSENRTAGVITFSIAADVDVKLSTNDTCSFIQGTSSIKYAAGGGTDILKALTAASTEIQQNAVHNQTLVFLITDGLSQTDPATAAAAIRNAGHILFAVGVAGYNQAQLEPLVSVGPDGTTNFFGISNFQIFQAISDYLNSTYTNGNSTCTNSFELYDLS